MCAWTSVNGRACPAQAQARVEVLDLVERVAGTRRPGRASSRSRSRARRGRAGGRRRSACGGRAGRGRRATARGRASRRPAKVPRSVSISTPGSRSRSGSTIAGDAEALPLARLRVGAQRRLGHAALPRDLDAALHRGVGVLRRACVMCSWLGCIHSSHPVALDDRRRLPVVVGVGVRADEQLARCSTRRFTCAERALEVRERARLVHPGVERGRCRRRPRPPRRCSAGRPATAAAGAGARRRAARARHGRARACGWARACDPNLAVACAKTRGEERQ